MGGTGGLFSRFTTCDPADVIQTLTKYKMNFLGGSLHFVHRVAKYASENGISHLPVQLALLGGSTIYRYILK